MTIIKRNKLKANAAHTTAWVDHIQAIPAREPVAVVENQEFTWTVDPAPANWRTEPAPGILGRARVTLTNPTIGIQLETPEMATLPDIPIKLKNVVVPPNDAPGALQGTPGNTVASMKTQFKRNKLKRLVSVEIEVNGCKLPEYIYPVTNKWQCSIVEDASLPAYGFEINSAPANGDKFVEQMEDFADAFIKSEAYVSERCGLHTHADARDFNAYDVRRMIKLYWKVEDGLFSIVPEERRHNRYAAKCGDMLVSKITSVAHPKTSKRRLIETIYKDVDDFKAMKETKHIDQRKRRVAMNIHSWAFRKTFELRLPNGSVTRDDLVNWAILWGTIVDWAYKLGERQIDAISDESFTLLLKIAPTDAIYKWLNERRERYY